MNQCRFVCASMFQLQRKVKSRRTYALLPRDAQDKKCCDAGGHLWSTARLGCRDFVLRAKLQMRGRPGCYSIASPAPCDLLEGRRYPQETRRVYRRAAFAFAESVR